MLKDTIKKLRTEQGLSQDELAERIHVVRQTVSESGSVAPRFPTPIRLWPWPAPSE